MTTYYVSTTGSDANNGLSAGTAFLTIQAAVNAAPDGSTIEIADGVYVEQLEITGKSNLTLHGGADVTIQAPADVVVTGFSSSDRSINAVVTVSGGTNVQLENITVDGAGAGNSVDVSPGHGAANFVGVFYRNASGGLTNVDITGVHDAYPGGLTVDGFPVQSGNQRGVGLQVDNNGPAKLAFSMTGGSISDFQKNATVFNNADLDVSGVTINGGGSQPINAQNGFQVLNSTGSIHDNTVNGIGYSGAQLVSATSVLAYQNTNLDIVDNTINAPEDDAAQSVGIYLYDFGVPSSGGSVTGNTVNHADDGIYVGAQFTAGTFTLGDNTITDASSSGQTFDPAPGSVYSLVQLGTDGPDTFDALPGNQTFDGNGGIDTIDMTEAGTVGAFVDLDAGLAFSSATGIDSVQEIENVRGSAGTDGLFGTATANTFYATAGADVIDGRGANDGDTFDASDAATGLTVDLTAGSVSGAYTATLTSIESVKTGAGNDTITLSSDTNVVDGGAGVDTVVTGVAYAGSPAIDWNPGAQAFTYGADTLKNVEKMSFTGGTTVWLVHSSAELTTALAGAVDGDVIKLANGTYEGNFTISDAVTIESASGDAGDVVFSGNFRSLNGLPEGGDVAAYLKTHGSPVATGNGLTISHDNVTLKNITITEYSVGIAIGTNTGLTITDVDFDSNLNAIRKGEAANVTDFNWTGGTVSNGQFGMNIYAATNDAGSFDDVHITDVTFTHLFEKGLYFEQLSNAVLDQLHMNDVGQFGSITQKFGSGIDINLKYEAYSNIEIKGFDFVDVGLSSSDTSGAAIVVKARDDGSYGSPNQATLNNVNIHDGSIDGTSTGIRIGEPGKVTTGPTNVTIHDVDITDAAHGSYDNQTLTPRIIQLSDDADTVTTSATSTGPIAYQGGDGPDHMTGSNASEGFDGGAGNDTIDGGGGTDAVGYAGNYSDAEFGFTGGAFTIKTSATDTDTITNVEQAVFANGTPTQGDDTKVWLVSNATQLATALAGAGNGDVIKLASGHYVGDFTISGKTNVMIESATGNAGDVVFEGQFTEHNAGYTSGTVGDYIARHAYSGGAGNGLTISGSHITVRNVTFTDYENGVRIGASDHVTLEGVVFDDNVTGLYKEDGAALVSYFTIKGGSFTDSARGIIVNAANNGTFDHVTIDGTHFENLSWKGAYFEGLSNANLTGITMDDVGQYGRGPSFGGTPGTDGTGIELNLKYNDYSNITIQDFTLNDVGMSNKDGDADPNGNGSAIAVKARGDGSYSGDPATIANVVIKDGTIDGTSTGIRVGEPGKAGTGGSAVTVTDVKIDNAVSGEYDNQTTSTLTVTVDDGDGFNDDVNVSSNPDATGVIKYIDSSTHNTTYTVNEGDIVQENSATGTDTVNARGSFTLGANVENLNLVDAGSSSEDFQSFDTGPLSNGEHGWKVLNGSDQEIVDLSGNKVFRMSSDTLGGDYGGPYSAALSVTAGEPATTADGDVHVISFDFKAVSDSADDSRLEVDFATAAGTDRNNFMSSRTLPAAFAWRWLRRTMWTATLVTRAASGLTGRRSAPC